MDKSITENTVTGVYEPHVNKDVARKLIYYNDNWLAERSQVSLNIKF